jgi:hypothetical protein
MSSPFSGLFASLATVFIVYSRTDSLADWTEAETYVLIGTVQDCSSLYPHRLSRHVVDTANLDRPQRQPGTSIASRRRLLHASADLR